jgi:hypothetical protein
LVFLTQAKAIDKRKMMESENDSDQNALQSILDYVCGTFESDPNLYPEANERKYTGADDSLQSVLGDLMLDKLARGVVVRVSS